MGNLGEPSVVGWQLVRYLNLAISGGYVGKLNA
jgi:hypothetical protein